MRFFTAEMWDGWQSEEPRVALRWSKYFQQALDEYRRQLPALVKRLPAKAGRFFDTDIHLLHDGTLREWRVLNFHYRQLPNVVVSVEANGTGAQERWLYGYTLTYRKVSRALFDQPRDAGFGSAPLYWGYDELTDGSDGTLRHEILFDSFATLELVFESFSWQRRRLPQTDR
jgi:hypothetical protein